MKTNSKKPKAIKKKKVPIEYLGAFKEGHRAGVREFIDDELAHSLLNKVLKGNDPEAKKQLDYLTKFNNEFYRGVLKKNDPNALHNTPELYKSATNNHNVRRRDVTTREREFMPSVETYQEMMETIEEPINNQKFLNQNRDLNHEDHVIEILDSLNQSDEK